MITRQVYVQLFWFFALFHSTHVLGQEWDEPTSESQILTASSGWVEDAFGVCVSAYGDLLVVGNPIDHDTDISSFDSGAAYVFRFDDVEEEWAEEQRIVASDGSTSDRFGSSVAAYEDTVVIGAPLVDDGDDDDVGSVYIFLYDSGTETWEEEQILSASDGTASARFGSSVAKSGSIIVVGASGDDEEGPGAGAAYVFRYDDTLSEWSEEQKLTASDAGFLSFFGGAVSVFDDVLAVTAGGDDEAGQYSGATYIFRDVSGLWEEEAKLTASDADAWQVFGSSVAVDDALVVVGAWLDDEEAVQAGAIYVYDYDSVLEEWNETKITASDAAAEDRFGTSVAVLGNLVVVGSQRDDESGDDSGSAYLYTRDSVDDDWVELLKYEASDGDENNRLGTSVAASDMAIIVGAVDNRSSALGKGAVYLHSPPVPFLRGDTDGDGDVAVLVDSVYLLDWAFADGTEPGCHDAADIDDDGNVSGLLDALTLLQYAFSDGSIPPDPGTEECGFDPTQDDVDCITTADDCL